MSARPVSFRARRQRPGVNTCMDCGTVVFTTANLCQGWEWCPMRCPPCQAAVDRTRDRAPLWWRATFTICGWLWWWGPARAFFYRVTDSTEEDWEE
jgi:hypothetical protein